MDDQIMNICKATSHDEPTCLREIDISNHTMMAEWIKNKLQELDDVLTQGLALENID